MSLFLGYLIIPRSIFDNWHAIIGALFLFLFALTLTCLIKNLKEKVIIKRNQNGSILGIVATILGIVGIQGCAASLPACTMPLWLMLFSLFLPGSLISFFIQYGIFIVIIAIILQILSLYFMGCFKKSR